MVVLPTPLLNKEYLIDGFIIGWEGNYSELHLEDHASAHVRLDFYADVTFCAIFVIELGLRVWSYCGESFYGGTGRGNSPTPSWCSCRCRDS